MFEAALARLVLELPLSLRPAEAGWLVRASSQGRTMDAVMQGALRRDYGRWCEAHEAPGDCLSLLENGLGLDAGDRLKVALGLSLDPMHESLADAVEETLNPTFFKAVVVSALVSWVVLAAAPEPLFTKAAAVVAVVMLAYMGGDAFLALVAACRELHAAAGRATTFQELEEAGERFGRVVGTQGARVFVLAISLVVGRGTAGGTTWLASRMPLLPGFAEASALGASQVGVNLAAAGQVSAVAVVEGTIAITLAPTAVAMSALGSGGGSPGAAGLPPGGPGEWVRVNESMPERARRFQSQATGVPEGYVYRVRAGGEQADFDGFDPRDGALLEVKGPGYARFLDDKQDPKAFFQGGPKAREQAERQFRVAQGSKVRWIVAEEEFAVSLRKLFASYKLKIDVVHLPPIP
ncbi:MAG TPA: Tox-REase-5 domain-containing protein [Myxococcus sp.]|nr:Tox-REase-5 domain-containing protein [Myxococcus sp.]